MNATCFIVNPTSAGGRTRRGLSRLHDALTELFGVYSVIETEYAGHAQRIAREMVESGYRTIVSVGGDGTLNEVVNGLVKDDKLIDPDVKLGIIPAGTGGDFRRNFNIENKLYSNCHLIARGQTSLVDVGKLSFVKQLKSEHRYFHNISSVGVSAEIAAGVNALKSSKLLGGRMVFFSMAVQKILRANTYQMNLVINDDEEVLCNNVNLIAIANGRFFGGGMQIAPNAKLNDGELDVIIFHGFNRVNMLLNNLKIYRGTHLKNRGVVVKRGRKITLASNPNSSIELDGEIPGITPVIYTCIPSVLPVIH